MSLARLVNRRNKRSGHRAERRFRPLGLSIAILSSGVIYGIYPLVPGLLLVWVKVIRPGSDIGADFIGGTPGWIALGFGVLTLFASVLAWIGRPRGIRLAFLLLIWAATLFQAFRAIQTLVAPVQPVVGRVGGSLDITPAAILCQIPVFILVPLYVTWYLNRAPARAFYAGKPSVMVAPPRAVDKVADKAIEKADAK